MLVVDRQAADHLPAPATDAAPVATFALTVLIVLCSYS